MLGINKRQTICATSAIGVGTEQLVSSVQGNSIDLTHIALDTATHGLLNILHIHFNYLEKHCGKKGSRVVEASIDALLHLLGKYGAHHLIHHIEHSHRNVEKIAEHIKTIDNHDTCSVSIITLPILACLVAEQVYKNLFDQKFHR